VSKRGHSSALALRKSLLILVEVGFPRNVQKPPAFCLLFTELFISDSLNQAHHIRSLTNFRIPCLHYAHTYCTHLKEINNRSWHTHGRHRRQINVLFERFPFYTEEHTAQLRQKRISDNRRFLILSIELNNIHRD
jgi:hypothetical protein